LGGLYWTCEVGIVNGIKSSEFGEEDGCEVDGEMPVTSQCKEETRVSP
jgi:hypothetical protein